MARTLVPRLEIRSLTKVYDNTKVVDSVDAMVANQKTSDINQVSIDAVPDFSGLMGKMKDAGKI